MRSVIDKSSFGAWLDGSSPGEKVTYHTGLLVSDRERSREVDDVAAAVRQAWSDGTVTMTQERSGNSCKYIAVKK